MGKFGQCIGCGGSNHKGIAPLRFGNVINAILFRIDTCFFPQAGQNPVSGKRGKGKRLHKPAGRLRHDNADFNGLTLQSPDKFGGLIRRNSARDAYDDAHGLIVEQGSGIGYHEKIDAESRLQPGIRLQKTHADYTR